MVCYPTITKFALCVSHGWIDHAQQEMIEQNAMDQLLLRLFHSKSSANIEAFAKLLKYGMYKPCVIGSLNF